jgi:hypothetical protein
MKSVIPIIFFLALSAFVFYWIYNQIRYGRRPFEKPFSYKSRRRLFTPTEDAFLYALEKAVGDEYRIFGKVRLADILDTEIYRGVGDKAFSLIAYKHVDFVLCDKRGSLIVCAVELDDWTHQSEKRKIKDAEKTYALNSAKIPLARFSVESGYDLGKIRAKLLEVTGRTDVARILPALVCPKCGANRVARRAKTGVHAGEFFIGCSNYPNCKFTAH